VTETAEAAVAVHHPTDDAPVPVPAPQTDTIAPPVAPTPVPAAVPTAAVPPGHTTVPTVTVAAPRPLTTTAITVDIVQTVAARTAAVGDTTTLLMKPS
jgi:hypothetical protein